MAATRRQQVNVLARKRKVWGLFLAQRSIRQIAESEHLDKMTVRRYVDQGLTELSSDVQALAGKGRILSTARLNQLYGRLEARQIAPGCKECGRSRPDDRELVSLIGESRMLEKRMAELWGWDEPAELRVIDKASEGINEFAVLVRTVINDHYHGRPAEAASILAAIDYAICVANGDPPPVAVLPDAQLEPEKEGRQIER